MTKIVCTSDWHGAFLPDFPEGDILVVAGDLCPVWDHSRQFQASWVREELIPHLRELPYKDIVLVAGNHDFVFQNSRKLHGLFKNNLHFLEDEGKIVQGLNFWGTPWSVSFGDWAFMMPDEHLLEQWAKISINTDVLVSHGPPFGCRDHATLFGDYDAGSKTLRQRIVQISPILVVTGHIHEGYGRDLIGRTTVVNGSFRDKDYNPVNSPIVIDINK